MSKVDMLIEEWAERDLESGDRETLILLLIEERNMLRKQLKLAMDISNDFTGLNVVQIKMMKDIRGKME